MANKFISDDELYKAEHEALCRLVLGEGTGDFVLGKVVGILQLVSGIADGVVID
jgi:hypothetical protein